MRFFPDRVYSSVITTDDPARLLMVEHSSISQPTMQGQNTWQDHEKSLLQRVVHFLRLTIQILGSRIVRTNTLLPINHGTTSLTLRSETFCEPSPHFWSYGIVMKPRRRPIVLHINTSIDAAGTCGSDNRSMAASLKQSLGSLHSEP